MTTGNMRILYLKGLAIQGWAPPQTCSPPPGWSEELIVDMRLPIAEVETDQEVASECLVGRASHDLTILGAHLAGRDLFRVELRLGGGMMFPQAEAAALLGGKAGTMVAPRAVWSRWEGDDHRDGWLGEAADYEKRVDKALRGKVLRCSPLYARITRREEGQWRREI